VVDELGIAQPAKVVVVTVGSKEYNLSAERLAGVEERISESEGGRVDRQISGGAAA